MNRFAALHPERVLSVTAGGLNEMALLPVEGADPPVAAVTGGVLPYPVGIGDVEALPGDPVDRSAFLEVTQFLYLGGEDDNDTLLYPDAFGGNVE
ncbi:hypothetical protein BRC60_01015 [Halobacteriales archaeon QH_1_68_42]|nr:MAG: hypothetical protein BRC60_01015 [Halobacteriales archaeon QH_1_68_42]